MSLSTKALGSAAVIAIPVAIALVFRKQISDFFQGGFDFIGGGISESIQNTQQGIDQFVQDTQQGIDQSIQGTQQGIDQFAQDSQTNINNFTKGISDFFGGLVNTITGVPDVVNNIREPLGITEQGAPAPGQSRIVKEILTPENTVLDTPVMISDIAKQQPKNNKLTNLIPSVIKDTAVKITGSFGSSGVGQQGFIINENPIDTFSEVLEFFPGITASQAADFLEETGGGILPSQVPFIDADIRNIVAAGGDIPKGSQVLVDTETTPTELKIEESKAACISCQMFGLNCDICNGGGGA